jgi:hypothetical protein
MKEGQEKERWRKAGMREEKHNATNLCFFSIIVIIILLFL